MSQKFIHAVASHIDSIRHVDTKYGARTVVEIQMIGRPKTTFWLSPKQGSKLEMCADFLERDSGYSNKKREVHLVLEEGEKGLRFVWAGIHTAQKSELRYLESQFGIIAESPYIGRPDLNE